MSTTDGKQPTTFGSPESATIPDRVLQAKFESVEPAAPEVSREEKARSEKSKLPTPTGFKVLIVPYSQPKQSKGGIHLPDETVRVSELATTVGYVLALGPDAYQDQARYPKGPWCQEGDYVLFGRYAGARIIMDCGDNDTLPLRLLNDDEIIAVLDNPEDYVGVN